MDPAWEAAVAILCAGGVVAVPTDTVWGLVARSDDVSAIDRIYAIKGRPADLELPLLAASIDDLEGLVEFNPSSRRLADAHWPGALTLIVICHRPRTALAVPRRGTTLAVRVPAHAALRALMARTGPLASTSANRHGLGAATSFEEVRQHLGGSVDLVVESDAAVGGTSSTIVDCTAEPCIVVRAGAIDPFR